MNIDDEQAQKIRAIAQSRKCGEKEALSFLLALYEDCERGKAAGDQPVMWCTATSNGGIRPLRGYGGPPNPKRRRFDHD